MIGQSLGQFQILHKLGEGGMGEVYQARDTKLHRDVALKLLPDAFATDPDRLARFRREAQVLAALNHINIAAIYGFEDAGPAHALVLELVDGQTLADRIAEGPIPLAQALPIARQIATGLDAAHEQGIVHRDLKPANVKIKDDGTVKILDFGLAKAMASDADSSPSSVSNSPTLTARATQLGMILGTAAYMAPEQAKARAVDRRADIWAFGVVLFEMLSGRRAFDGDDISDVLASVLKTEPDWTKLPADLPVPVRRLLTRCLEKDPKRRLRDIAEGMLQLEDGLSAANVSAISSAADTVPAHGAPAQSWWRRALSLGATAIITAVVVTLFWRQLTPAPARSALVRFQYAPPASDGLYITQQGKDIALSDDGQLLVHTAQRFGGGIYHLRLRRLDQLESAEVPGTEGGWGAFFSPDNQWIGFLSDNEALRLQKIPVTGGTPSLVTQSKVPIMGATWLADGSIVIGSSTGGLRRVPAGGGESVELTSLDPASKETAHRWPSAIPGTSLVLFGFDPGGAIRGVAIGVVDVQTKKVVRLNVTGYSPKYASTGHLVFTTYDGSLRAQPFDLRRLEPSGTASLIAENVRTKASGTAAFDLATNNTLVYAPGSGTEVPRTLSWVDRAGHETPVGAPTRNYYYARVSPNGSRLSLDIRDQAQDIWIWDARGTLTRLTADDVEDQYGLWTPDGQRVIFESNRVQKRGIYIVRADGVGTPELLAEHNGFPNAVTPDGKTVVIRGSSSATKNDLFLLAIGGDHTVKPLFSTEHDELNATISNDGKWMAYQSDLSGQMDIWVRPFPNVNDGQTLISTKGGSEPVWSPIGNELFYLSADNKIMSVRVSTVNGFAPGAPAPLFDARPYFFGGVGRNYDISPDGKRFIMVKNPATASASEPIFVVLNWTSELRK